MPMLVTVAIVTWNRAQILDQTLKQFNQLIIPDGISWELIVVDNKSTDNTKEIIYKHRFSGRLPIIYVYEKRTGQSYAKNTAIECSHGDYILWTDDDALVDPLWLKEIIKAFDLYKADFVYGPVEPCWETGPPSWYSREFDGYFALVDHGPEIRLMPGPPYIGAGVNHAVRRSAYDIIGKYRQDLGIKHDRGGGFEDVEIFNRAYSCGLKVVYTPYAKVRHFIPNWRCSKNFYRSRVWKGSNCFRTLLLEKAREMPKIMGLPRYIYRINIENAAKYLYFMLTRESSKAFFYELKLILFVGAVYNSFKEIIVGDRK